MRKREYLDYLQDILDSIDDIASFTDPTTFESFKEDRKTIYAVIRCIEVIGDDKEPVPPKGIEAIS